MKILENIVRRATGMPHPIYLHDPVLSRYYQRSRKKVPLPLLGFFVCLFGSLWLSVGTNFTGSQIIFPLITLLSSMSLLLMRIHFMHPKQDVDMSFLGEVLNDATVSEELKTQLRYIIINKAGNVILDDLYRLFDFNSIEHILASGPRQATRG
ncbi:hypothetical protein D3981_003041 [Escherichia coli]|nr:hypothetical protein [Escherichia coli]